MPTAFLPASNSMTLSTRRKGYRCGRMAAICSLVKSVLRSFETPEAALPPRHSPSAASPSAAAIMRRGAAVWDWWWWWGLDDGAVPASGDRIHPKRGRCTVGLVPSPGHARDETDRHERVA